MSLSPIEKAASGALASAIANTLVYPLDLSKVLIQTQVKKNKPKSGSNGIPTPPSESDLEDSVYKQKVDEDNGLKYKNTIDVLTQIYKRRGSWDGIMDCFLPLLVLPHKTFPTFTGTL